MLDNLNLNKVLFLDIETVPSEYNFEELDSIFQKLWEEKTVWQRKDEFTPSEYYKKKAGIMAEFAKIICISVGYLFTEKGESHFRIKSFYGDDEKTILKEFNHLLKNKFNDDLSVLCANNGQEAIDITISEMPDLILMDLSIPVKYRKAISPIKIGTFVLTRGFDRCLILYPLDEWKKVEFQLGSLSSIKIKHRNFVIL